MRTALHIYHFVNILSIDVAAGAIVSALFFAKIFEVHIKPQGLIALGLTVWIIYTADHLRDAKKIRHQAATRRHRFHQQYFSVITMLLGIALALNILTIFFIDRQIVEWGLILFFAIVLCMMAQRSLLFLKETFIAFLYTGGVLLLSVTVTTVNFSLTHCLLIGQFALLAWINLIMFSWFDQEYDQVDKQNSFVTIVGRQAASYCLYVFWLLNFLSAIILFCMEGITVPLAILLLMNSILFLIFFFRTVLAKNELFRLLGDAVFLFPAFFLL